MRTYEELMSLPTFKERYEYLKLDGKIGESTFGFDRYINQIFYKGGIWRSKRLEIIARDLGHDLGMLDDMYEVQGSIYVHHMNPVDIADILNQTEYLLDERYLITVSSMTHNAIHYGTFENIHYTLPTRTRNDTCPWKR